MTLEKPPKIPGSCLFPVLGEFPVKSKRQDLLATWYSSQTTGNKQLVIIAILDTCLSTYTHINLYYTICISYIFIHNKKKTSQKKTVSPNDKKNTKSKLRSSNGHLGCHFCPAFVGARVHGLSKNTHHCESDLRIQGWRVPTRWPPSPKKKLENVGWF